jgi:hypothetical protein
VKQYAESQKWSRYDQRAEFFGLPQKAATYYLAFSWLGQRQEISRMAQSPEALSW